MMNVVINTKIL